MVRSREEAADAVIEAFKRDPALAHLVLARTQALQIIGPWTLTGDRWVRVPLATSAAQGLPRGWYITKDKQTFGGQVGHLIGRLGDQIPFAVCADMALAVEVAMGSIAAAAPGAHVSCPDGVPGAAPAPTVEAPQPAIPAQPGRPVGTLAPPRTTADLAPLETHEVERIPGFAHHPVRR